MTINTSQLFQAGTGLILAGRNLAENAPPNGNGIGLGSHPWRGKCGAALPKAVVGDVSGYNHAGKEGGELMTEQGEPDPAQPERAPSEQSCPQSPAIPHDPQSQP